WLGAPGKLEPRSVLSAAILFFLVPLALPGPAETSLSSPIKGEIARLQQSLKDKPISDPDLNSVATMNSDALKAAPPAADAGQLYLSLETLGQAEDLLQGARSAADRAEVEKTGLPAFESRWGTASKHLTAIDQDAHAREWKGSPLAIRALAEAAQARAIP